jgi:integrase
MAFAYVVDRWMRDGEAGREKSSRYGIGKRWTAVWTEAGTRRSQSFGSKDAAKAKVAQVDVDQRSGTHALTNRMTLGEYGEQWIRTQIHHRDSTSLQLESRWRLHIKPALGAIRLSDLTRVQVQNAVIMWSETLAASTVGVVYSYLTSLLKAAVVDRLIRESPCVRIKLPKEERERVVPLRVQQVRVIAEQISPWFRGMVWVAAGTGMRSGELRGLTVDRLHLDDGALRIRVDRQLITAAPSWGPPKTHRGDRWISVDRGTAKALAEHMQAYPPRPDGLIFYGRTGVPLARNSMQAAWQIATKGVAVRPRSGWHDLRHFHASMLIAAGLSVVAVAERLGHTVTECSETYAHLWPGDDDRMRDAVALSLWGGVTVLEQSAAVVRPSVTVGHSK